MFYHNNNYYLFVVPCQKTYFASNTIFNKYVDNDNLYLQIDLFNRLFSSL